MEKKPVAPDVRALLEDARAKLPPSLAAKFRATEYDPLNQRLVGGCGTVVLQWDPVDREVRPLSVAPDRTALQPRHFLTRGFSDGGSAYVRGYPGGTDNAGGSVCVYKDGRVMLGDARGGVCLPCTLLTEFDLHQLLVGLQLELGGVTLPKRTRSTKTLADVEKEHIAEALGHGDTQAEVARRLGIDRSTLRAKKALYGLS